MKNALLFLVLAFLNPNRMSGQSCLSGGITFDYQWQVDEFPIHFPGCRHILGHVIINDSAEIYSLDSLYSLDSISGDLQLLNNSLLPDFQGLNQLVYLGGALNVHFSIGLESYAGLENLVEIRGDFNFDIVNRVATFADFKSLREIGGQLHLNSISKNSLDFPVLARIGGDLNVSFGSLDPEGPQTVVFTGPDSLRWIGGDVRFGYDDKRDELPDLLWCRDVTHISGFNQLDTIEGNLFFWICRELIDASGFSSLKFVGKDVVVYQAWNLKSLDFLSKIDYIGGSFIAVIAGRDTTFAFLKNLKYLGKDFTLAIHPTSDLVSLQSFTHINGTISISSCFNLTSLVDLKNIISVEGSLLLNENQSLGSLSGLEGLNYIGDSLLILNNDALSSLINLSPDLKIGKYVDLQGNSKLSMCGVESICTYLEDPLAPAFIQNNFSGCQSRQEVEEDCGFVAIQSPTDSHWQITPNPGGGLYLIEFPKSYTDFQVVVFDLYGGQVHFQSSSEGNYLDIRNLPAGSYLVRIQNKNVGLNTIIHKL